MNPYDLIDPSLRQQAFYQGLLGLGAGLMQGGAPSTQPGGMARGVGQGLLGFQHGMGSATQQALMNAKLSEASMNKQMMARRMSAQDAYDKQAATILGTAGPIDPKPAGAMARSQSPAGSSPIGSAESSLFGAGPVAAPSPAVAAPSGSAESSPSKSMADRLYKLGIAIMPLDSSQGAAMLKQAAEMDPQIKAELAQAQHGYYLKNGQFVSAPGLDESMARRKGLEAATEVGARIGTEYDMRGKKAATAGAVSGAEAGARNASELAYAPRLAEARYLGETRGQLANVQTPAGMMPAATARHLATPSVRDDSIVLPMEVVGGQRNPTTIGMQGVPGSAAPVTGRGSPGTYRFGNSQAFSQEDKLRNDFAQNPNVKMFRESAPIIASMRDAAGRDTLAADLNIVYGIAKIFDPTSVVREGETVMVRNTANLPEYVKGALNSLMGGGRLTGEVRKSLMTEAESRVSGYQAQHDAVAKETSAIARRYMLRPENVIVSPAIPSISGDIKALRIAVPPPAGFRVID